MRRHGRSAPSGPEPGWAAIRRPAPRRSKAPDHFKPEYCDEAYILPPEFNCEAVRHAVSLIYFWLRQCGSLSIIAGSTFALPRVRAGRIVLDAKGENVPENETGAAPALCLDGPLTIGSADLIRARILEAINSGYRIEIDCQEAAEVDISFIQILIAARMSARRQGHFLTLSDRLRSVIRDVLSRGGLLADASADLLAEGGFGTGETVA